MGTEKIKETAQGLLLHVKVTPKARQNKILGWENDILRIKVIAAPEKGEANQAVVALLSQILHIPKKNIVLVSGATSRIKFFCLEGITKSRTETLLSI